MNKNTRRIFVSILTLVLTVVAVGTTTFAWFTIGNIATVTGVQAEVMGGEGLEIQLQRKDDSDNVIGETTFKNNLSATDFTTLMPADFAFKAVEYDGTNFTKLGVFDNTTDHHYGSLYRGVEAIANGDYLEFTINFRSLSAGIIDLTNIVFDGPTIDYTAGVSYNTVEGTNTEGPSSVNSALALRVTFDGGTFSTAPQHNTYREGHSIEKDLGQWSYMKEMGNDIYENSTVSETDVPLTTSPGYVGTAFDSTNAVSITLTPPATGQQYHTASLTMRIWVDGWDPHAFDAIYEEVLSLSFTFEKQ